MSEGNRRVLVRMPQSSDKKKVPLEEWERKLAAVTVRKEDMNKLVMNFLVTEVLFQR